MWRSRPGNDARSPLRWPATATPRCPLSRIARRAFVEATLRTAVSTHDSDHADTLDLQLARSAATEHLPATRPSETVSGANAAAPRQGQRAHLRSRGTGLRAGEFLLPRSWSPMRITEIPGGYTNVSGPLSCCIVLHYFVLKNPLPACPHPLLSRARDGTSAAAELQGSCSRSDTSRALPVPSWCRTTAVTR